MLFHRNTKQFVLTTFALACFLTTATTSAQSGKKELSKTQQLALASQRITAEKYLLAYQFKPGETVYWETEQVDSGEVSLQKKKELTKSRTLSTKKWRIEDVLDNGDFIVVQSIESIDLWQQIDNRTPISYDSRLDTKPHPRFEDVADKVGIELVSFKAKPNGELVYKKANYSDVDLGVGGIIVQFPKEPVAVGHAWFQPTELKIPLPTGPVKRVKIRRAFKLLDVKHGVAKISVDTQVLTPIRDPEVEVQLMHQVTKGHIRFDIEQGRILSREFNWNRKVQGFSTADSLKKYIGRFKESLRSRQEVESRIGVASKEKIQIKLIDEGPIFR